MKKQFGINFIHIFSGNVNIDRRSFAFFAAEHSSIQSQFEK